MKTLRRIYLIYNPNNRDNYKIKSSVGTVESTITDNGDGTKTVVATTTLYCETEWEYYEDNGRTSVVSCLNYGDIYTGIRMPAGGSTDGNSARTNSFTFDLDGKDVTIEYTTEIKWNWGEWQYLDAPIDLKNSTMTKTFTAVVPSDYDGLCFYTNDYVRNYTAEEWEESVNAGYSTNESDPGETEYYHIDSGRENDVTRAEPESVVTLLK